MIPRDDAQAAIRRALRRSPIALLLGPRQCGKTTLAREFVSPGSERYFDLESPSDLARLAEPMTALAGLRGTVVIDEVQRRPDLFPMLRVLADRRPTRARFLVLGSASPHMLRQSAESLAGRIELVQLGPLGLAECGADRLERRWLRGGFPRSFLAKSLADSQAWRRDFIATIIERDLRAYDSRLPAPLAHRLWTMLAHHHGQVINLASVAGSLGIAVATVAPGFVETEMAAGYLDGPEGAARKAESPFNRVATAEEVADAVVYLASPQAQWASGAILDLNGASYLRM